MGNVANWYAGKIEEFRRLPTPLLVILVLSRFIFGVGLGAVLASSKNWRLFGWLTMATATALALPAARRVLSR